MATISIDQGTTRTIVVSGITDATGEPIPAGWVVRAVARRSETDPTVLAVWSSSPAPGEGTGVHTGPEVRLTVPPAMSRAWTWDTAVVHLHITEPGPPYREEDISGPVNLINNRTTVY